MNTINLFAIIIPILFSLTVPLGLMIVLRLKTGAKIRSFVAGAFCFTLFAMVLENILHRFCLLTDNAVSRTILASPVLYTLYAAFAAGIFEETGRLFGFKVLLRRHLQVENAAAYGVGHGGIEVLLLLGSSYIVMLLAALGLTIGDAAGTAKVLAAASNITLPMACIAVFERISALMIHIGLSLLVFRAVVGTETVKGNSANAGPATGNGDAVYADVETGSGDVGSAGFCAGYRSLYPAAIGLHALADVPAAMYQCGALTSLVIVEGAVFLMGAFCLYLGIRVNREKAGPDTKAEQSETASGQTE